MNQPEVWLRGPLNDIPALLQPVAHALMQAVEEVDGLMTGFPDELLWEQPAGLASPGFHLQHLSGVLDRLFTYARGEQLSNAQLQALGQEGVENGLTSMELISVFKNQVAGAISELSKADEVSLTAAREVGRGKLPSTVIGLYVHAAEHTMRHIGQLLVTVTVLKAQNQ